MRDIITQCASAMTGAEGAGNLRALCFEAWESGKDRCLKWEIIRPNLVRKEREKEFILLFDGTRAAFLEGPIAENGTLQGPHLVPEEDWHHFELDIAIYIPAFFEFAAEYAGSIIFDGTPAHRLQVKLPMGGEVIYIIHAESFLPMQVSIPAWNYQRNIGDYRQIGDFLLPHKYWSPSDLSKSTQIRKLVVNADQVKNRFEIPV